MKLVSKVLATTFTNLEPDKEYSFKIRASNIVGTSPWSNDYVVKTAIAPPDATSISITSNQNREQYLTWNLAPRAESYEIDCNGTQITIDSGNTNGYNNQNLIPNKTYNYKIRAVNSSGKSPWSNVVSERTTTNPPEPVKGLTYELVDDLVKITWNKDSESDKYELKIGRRDKDHNIDWFDSIELTENQYEKNI